MSLRSILAVLLMLASLTTTSLFASADIDYCPWEYCPLAGEPWLAPENDTRDNLLRLASEKKALPLPLTPMLSPDELPHSRKAFFGIHIQYPEPDTDTANTSASPATEHNAAIETLLSKQFSALNLDNAQLASLTDDDLENRFVSNSRHTLSGFFTALLADKTLTPEQRHSLASARLTLRGAIANDIGTLPAMSFIEQSSAQAFYHYLLATQLFYQGHYPQAAAIFDRLKNNKQPWVADTSAYMLIRNALNQSSQHATGEYDMFEIKKIDTAAAQQALSYAQDYLATRPDGRYADSAHNMLRRIYWYLQDQDALATMYERALEKATDADALREVVIETDNTLQSKDLPWGDSPFMSSPDAPLITASQTLRWFRSGEQKKRDTQPILDQVRPSFGKASLMPLWNYLHAAMLFWQQKDYAAITGTRPPQGDTSNDIVAFSQQVLYGDALMAQQKWSDAKQYWQSLMTGKPYGEQKQFLETRLASAMVLSGHPEELFTKESPIVNLRLRSLMLKTDASPALLRQQSEHGISNEERNIALHTLLTRDLINADYQAYLLDKTLRKHITQPVDENEFADVTLGVFDRASPDKNVGYYCRTLDHTVETLAKNGSDSHALNCLGEFVRLTRLAIDISPESGGNGSLDRALVNKFPQQPDRQKYYQRIIADPKAEPEDKSFALYRAVMCYAPSGYNDCGGEEIDKATRKAWFNRLKTHYPGSVWAKKLKYYW